MIINEAVKLVRERKALELKVEKKTEMFFMVLNDYFASRLENLHREMAGSAEITSQTDTKLVFKIENRKFSLQRQKGVSEMPQEEDKIREPEDKQYLTGCVVLTAQFNENVITLMRVFVNENGDFAYEYGIGWVVKKKFNKTDDVKQLGESLFDTPISDALTGYYKEWKGIETQRMYHEDDALYKTKMPRIGFNSN